MAVLFASAPTRRQHPASYTRTNCTPLLMFPLLSPRICPSSILISHFVNDVVNFSTTMLLPKLLSDDKILYAIVRNIEEVRRKHNAFRMICVNGTLPEKLFFLYINGRGSSYLGLTRSVSWLLMTWLLVSPGHQQPWHWLCSIGRFLSCLREYFNFLCHIIVEEWHIM